MMMENIVQSSDCIVEKEMNTLVQLLLSITKLQEIIRIRSNEAQFLDF